MLEGCIRPKRAFAADFRSPAAERARSRWCSNGTRAMHRTRAASGAHVRCAALVFRKILAKDLKHLRERHLEIRRNAPQHLRWIRQPRSVDMSGPRGPSCLGSKVWSRHDTSGRWQSGNAAVRHPHGKPQMRSLPKRVWLAERETVQRRLERAHSMASA